MSRKLSPLVALSIVALVAGCGGPSPLLASDDPWCLENSERIERYILKWNDTEPGREFSRQNGFRLSVFDFVSPPPEYVDHSECFPAPIKAWLDAGQPLE